MSLRVLQAVILVLSLFHFIGGAAAQTTSEFSCEKAFGPGFTPNPEIPFTCCYPGTVPVPGEGRCEKPGGGSAEAEETDTPGGHCMALGGTCTLGGSPCCEGECKGTFPLTSCQ